MQWLIARYLHAKSTGQEGWALMDAVWSSVVVVLAFMGTFLAIDASTKTATQDIRKSTAYDLAQNELDRLRSLGDAALPTLLAADNPSTPPTGPSRTVTLDGVNYTIWNRAYYVENIGTDVTDACGSAASATNGTTAQFVYIKTSVYWPGMTGSNGPSGATGSLVPQPAVLDAYFAPEGGDLQTSTGTLRLFVQNMAGTAIVGKTVELRRKVGASTVSVGTKTTGAPGCVLFTGLQRGDYEAHIPTSSEYDLYMTTNPVKVPIKVTTRASISRTIKIGQPVTVVPLFETNGTGTWDPVTPGAAGTSTFVGPWMAASPEILSSLPPEFMTGPGMTFMPHQASGIANKMFALDTGYTTFAGPCDINDPGTSDRVAMGSSIHPSWTAGGTYAGARTLRIPNFRIRLTASPVSAGTGKIQVKLVDRVGGGAGYGNCGARASFFDNWIRLPGTVDTNGYLTVPAYAVPTGRYEICVQQRGPWGWWGAAQTRYVHLTNRDNSYPGPNAVSINVGTSGTTSGDTSCNSGIGGW